MTTITIVNAIITVGNQITTALAPSGSQTSGDVLKKSIDELRALLIPGEKERAAKKIKNIKAVLEKEVASGPFKVKLMGGKKGKKGSLKRK